MLTFKAGYKFVDDGVHAQVIDFPEVISAGANLDEARRMLASALVEIAQLHLDRGEGLPTPNALAFDSEMDLDEPIQLAVRERVISLTEMRQQEALDRLTGSTKGQDLLAKLIAERTKNRAHE